MNPDPYGIPNRIFGPLSPELPALIGRVAMLSALLEAKVWAITSSIDNKIQSAYASENVSKNIGLGKKRLKLYQENDREKKFASTTGELLDNIDVALSMRNEIVHRVWPVSGEGEWAGWKPDRKNKTDPVKWSDWRAFSRDELIGLITELVQLIDRAGGVIADAGSIPRRAI